jgi:hypothetical protein
MFGNDYSKLNITMTHYEFLYDWFDIELLCFILLFAKFYVQFFAVGHCECCKLRLPRSAPQNYSPIVIINMWQ